ncbi:hypothetical protein [Flavobacterium sp. 1355]|uniref:hypothetical protein n=1 Tax=Flavobacterium sp. 1355 TaxID=2806571 RepID=UPI001AE5D732|nr:hypothetical protein [Flavobacterium sp. 1355]MBP1222652.1 hypothetical protein [Flavobacterium sp. 1355]
MMAFFQKLVNYFKEKKIRKAARAATLARVTSDYEALINELRLIQEKKSVLSRSERDFVELRIKHLIAKGHIQVNK